MSYWCQFLSVSFEVVPFTDFVNSFLPSFVTSARLVSPGDCKESGEAERDLVAEPTSWGPLVVIHNGGIIFKRYLSLNFPRSAYFVVYTEML